MGMCKNNYPMITVFVLSGLIEVRTVLTNLVFSLGLPARTLEGKYILLFVQLTRYILYYYDV